MLANNTRYYVRSRIFQLAHSARSGCRRCAVLSQTLHCGLRVVSHLVLPCPFRSLGESVKDKPSADSSTLVQLGPADCDIPLLYHISIGAHVSLFLTGKTIMSRDGSYRCCNSQEDAKALKIYAITENSKLSQTRDTLIRGELHGGVMDMGSWLPELEQVRTADLEPERWWRVCCELVAWCFVIRF